MNVCNEAEPEICSRRTASRCDPSSQPDWRHAPAPLSKGPWSVIKMHLPNHRKSFKSGQPRISEQAALTAIAFSSEPGRLGNTRRVSLDAVPAWRAGVVFMKRCQLGLIVCP